MQNVADFIFFKLMQVSYSVSVNKKVAVISAFLNYNVVIATIINLFQLTSKNKLR